jgi:hypothetical protein
MLHWINAIWLPIRNLDRKNGCLKKQENTLPFRTILGLAYAPARKGLFF